MKTKLQSDSTIMPRSSAAVGCAVATFDSREVFRVLENLHLKFIMPAIKSDRIKQVVKDNSNKENYFLKYIMGTKKNNVAFNLVVKYDEKDKEYHIFATNFEIKYKTDIERIAEMYRKRWGIETGYRVKKDFLAITTTECCTVRMLYFMISVILYNFWLLCNLVYCRERGIELGTPKITTRVLKIYVGKNIVMAIELVKIDSKSNTDSLGYLLVIKKSFINMEIVL